MTRPWHRRALRVRPATPRTSAAVRLRAHCLALGAWVAAGGTAWRSTALLSPGDSVALRTRLALRVVADGWAAAARRWA